MRAVVATVCQVLGLVLLVVGAFALGWPVGVMVVGGLCVVFGWGLEGGD